MNFKLKFVDVVFIVKVGLFNVKLNCMYYVLYCYFIYVLSVIDRYNFVCLEVLILSFVILFFIILFVCSVDLVI